MIDKVRCSLRPGLLKLGYKSKILNDTTVLATFDCFSQFHHMEGLQELDDISLSSALFTRRM